jgi:hypothetical protein
MANVVVKDISNGREKVPITIYFSLNEELPPQFHVSGNVRLNLTVEPEDP